MNRDELERMSLPDLYGAALARGLLHAADLTPEEVIEALLAQASEPERFLDLEELPESYGVDECAVIPQSPLLLFVYWEITPTSVAVGRTDLREEGSLARLMLRIYSTAPPRGDRGDHGEPLREWQDYPVDERHGRRYLAVPRSAGRVRAAIGLLTPTGLFAPIAHSPAVEVPPADSAPQLATRWMTVPVEPGEFDTGAPAHPPVVEPKALSTETRTPERVLPPPPVHLRSRTSGGHLGLEAAVAVPVGGEGPGPVEAAATSPDSPPGPPAPMVVTRPPSAPLLPSVGLALVPAPASWPSSPSAPGRTRGAGGPSSPGGKTSSGLVAGWQRPVTR